MKHLYLPVLLFLGLNLSAQEMIFPASTIDTTLLKNANAVVREETVEVHLDAVDKMRVISRRVVTVLNDKGDRYGFAGDGYSNQIKIKYQRAVLYDKYGKEIKKYKQKEFEDRSMVGSNDLYNDHRVSYLDYTPREYPFTIEYISEIQKENTIFIQSWNPVSGHYLAVEKSSYKVFNPTGIPLRKQEKNLEGLQLVKDEQTNQLSYGLKNLPAYNYEYLSPALDNFAPDVQVALNNFSLVGIKGSSTSWEELGKWQYENLLKGRNILPEATKSKIAQLTANAQTDLEKAEIIYRFVQDNTRYISVQLGIGGWEPIIASEVDRLKYGDCKGLTNYTKALLDSQNIPSYYAVVYAGEDRKDLDAEFASMQGNHVILNLPQEGDDVWLECTSQTHPFNYLGDFTDNRKVLLLKPEGGEIVKTKKYTAAENIRKTNSRIELHDNGSFSASVKRESFGIPYGDIYGVMTASEKDQVLFYKKNWGHLRQLEITQLQFNNDRKNQKFTEDMMLTGEALASKAGKRLLLSLNFFHPDTYAVPRREERKRPVEVSRGRTYNDTFEYVLPAGFEPEALPEAVEIENEFGSYKFSASTKEVEGSKVIEVRRSYVINDGKWPAESYQDFRNFMNSIDTFSNQKAVIIAAP